MNNPDTGALLPVTPEQYLIRKGGAYYRPNAAGYTMNVAEAGRYSLEDAILHSHPNGPNGPRDGIDYMPAPPVRISALTSDGGRDGFEAEHDNDTFTIRFPDGHAITAWDDGRLIVTKAEPGFAPFAVNVAALAQPVEAGEAHWLIERRCDPPQWSTEPSPTGIGAFYSDIHRAHRFATKQEASDAMRSMSLTPKERGEYFVSEHVWIEHD